ncbi:unnamed protein product [Cuscuta campestris]|uniref:Pentacotripeptide-repeat region of PRORP domain-containing protein n=1 Tax=Cuscuta campestris TaxID=132261 RepID=A0A484M6G7_9ASTE|nr:unnamed protein product [Cuscuta campestris]
MYHRRLAANYSFICASSISKCGNLFVHLHSHYHSICCFQVQFHNLTKSLQVSTKEGFKVYRKCFMPVSFYSSTATRRLMGPPTRSLRRRMRKRALAASKPVLDESRVQKAMEKLPPRFTPEDLYNVMSVEEDPLVCLELFNWASTQHRFRHDVLTYHVTIKRLGAASMYKEMDDIVNQVLSVPYIGSEALFNTMIHYFIKAKKLIRAVNIFKHMQNSMKMDCRPSIITYNILFSGLLTVGRNTYISYMYMEAARNLFKQMINDGIEPDVFSLNYMIKGYVLSLHVNDALRIFHQMGAVYKCHPNSFSYDYLIHGLCAQGRTKNAQELCDEMKMKGFTPSSKSYNSLVNAFALGGEVENAVEYLWEMNENQRTVDFITYRTVVDEICRQQSVQDAVCFLKELQEKNLVGGYSYKRLVYELEDSKY